MEATEKRVCLKCNRTLADDYQGNVCYECFQTQTLTEVADKLLTTLEEQEWEEKLRQDYQLYAEFSSECGLPTSLVRYDLWNNLKPKDEQLI